MQEFSLSPSALFLSLWSNRHLVFTLVRREIAGRYRGSFLGILWSFFNPVFMLSVYTFVFSVVFNARWGVGTGSKAEFALVLFAGLIVFNLFAECVTRAPNLILQNPTYVKKVVFPLEVLPWVIFFAALFHAGVSLLVWLLFCFFILGLPPVTGFLFPLLIFPLLFLSLGFSWLLASLGVYLRDVSQIIGILVTALLFLTPIFYPLSVIPQGYRWIVLLNPLTLIVDQARDLLIFGRVPGWWGYALVTFGSLLISWAGFVWFQKTRKGFADVI
ncbi:MAG: ABC transporter permease [Desulfuromonadaceae bacterium]|nr:ABC transporter permease [Desulfuromonadaceae bacterium]NLV24098.1 ABC transporter permease [Deltaproteobacteria bacterium]